MLSIGASGAYQLSSKIFCNLHSFNILTFQYDGTHGSLFSQSCDAVVLDSSRLEYWGQIWLWSIEATTQFSLWGGEKGKQGREKKCRGVRQPPSTRQWAQRLEFSRLRIEFEYAGGGASPTERNYSIMSHFGLQRESCHQSQKSGIL